MQDFIHKVEKIRKFLDSTVFEIVGNEAMNHYKRSFINEGFTDSSLIKWKEVNRRLNPRKKQSADATRPILTRRGGDLVRSIRWRRDGRSVTGLPV